MMLANVMWRHNWSQASNRAVFDWLVVQRAIAYQRKQAVVTTNQRQDKVLYVFPRWAVGTVACFFEFCFVYCTLSVSTCDWFDFKSVITKPLTPTNLIDFLCEKVFVTYQICSSLFSAHFVDTMSKALQIPKWRLFNIRTEEGNEEGCLIVKFGIIGTGKLLPAN